MRIIKPVYELAPHRQAKIYTLRALRSEKSALESPHEENEASIWFHFFTQSANYWHAEAVKALQSRER